MRKTLLVLTALVIFAIPAMAQEQFGQITGIVSTEDGKAVVGAKVLLESPALIRSIDSTTNESGRFRFPHLPIGDYKITIEADQYKKYEQTDIIVRIGSSIRLDVTLEVGAFEDVVVISGEAPLIDTKNTDLGETIGKELLAKLPVPRFPTEMMNFAAGNVGGDYGTTQGSADYAANSFKLDGVDVSDPQVGTPWVFVNMESIEEIEMMPISGATADVGGFTGAAVNIVSKSGGNEFSGGGAYYYFDEDFITWNTDDETLRSRTSREALNNDFTAFLGGPVVKDQIWFFGNLGLRKAGQKRADTLNTQKYKNTMWKLSAALTDTINVWGMYHFDDYVVSGRGSAYYRDPETTTDQTSPNHSYAANMAWVLTDNDFIELGLAGFDGRFDYLGRTDGIYTYDYTLDWAWGGPYAEYETWRERNQLEAKYTKFVDELAGTHEFKFGGGFHLGFHKEDYRYDRIYQDDGYILYRVRYEYNGEVSWFTQANTQEFNAYATDSWEVNDRLTMNLGLRYERNTFEIPDQELLTGETVTGPGDIHTFNEFAPRFGFTFKVTEDGSTLVRGSAGRYFEKITTDVFSELSPVAPDLAYYALVGGQWVDDGKYPMAGAYTLDDDVSNQYTDAFTLGIEHELTQDIVVGLDYIHRENKNYIVNIERGRVWEPYNFSFDGNSYDVFAWVGGDEDNLITNDDGTMFSEYDAAIIRFTKRYSDRWQMNASLTLSKLYGNAADVGDTDWGWTGGNIGYWQDPNNRINSEGLLLGHRPWNLKVTGSYLLPYDISIAGFMSYVAGSRWTPTLYYYAPDLGWWEEVFILAEERGSQTLDDVFNLDLRLEKTFSWDRYRVSLLVDAYNIFNNGTITGIVDGIESSSYLDPTSIQQPRRFQLGARFSF